MSTSDIRLSVGLPTHPKTKKLKRLLGNDAVLALIYLFIFAAQNKPDGDLSGMESEDIEIAVDWEGEEGALVKALIKVGFLDEEEGRFRIHDWEDHNGWVYGFNDRSERSKFANLVRYHGREYAEQSMPDYAARLKSKNTLTAIPQETGSIQNTETSVKDSPNRSPNSPSRSPNSENRTPPLPFPSFPFTENLTEANASVVASVPLTTPDEAEKIASPPEEIADPPDPAVGKPAFPPCPQQEILALYAEILPELIQPRLWDGARSSSLAARWRWALGDFRKKGKAHDRDAGLNFFRRLFGYVAKSDFLMGRTQNPWRGCDLAWIVQSKNFGKIIEGKYENPA